jgi:peroxiredoxin
LLLRYYKKGKLKKMKRYILFAILVFSLMGFTKGPYNLNDTIENFSLTNAVDNTIVSLTDFSKAKAVVVVFNSPGCAYCKIYDERLLKLVKEFEGKEVNFIFINPNNPASNPDDSPLAMAKAAKEKGYTFPFLIDNKQKVADNFGATKTPEVFVLKNVNGSFALKYKGAIDDNPQLASDVSANYLKDAINSVLSNSAVKITEKRATGCMIKR